MCPLGKGETSAGAAARPGTAQPRQAAGGQTDRAPELWSGASAGLCHRKTTSHTPSAGEFCEVSQERRGAALSRRMPGEREGNHVPSPWRRVRR